MTTYFLKATNEAEMRAALAAAGYEFEGQFCTRFTLADWTPCENHTPDAIRHDVDIVGEIPDVEGFHANLTAHELHADLAALALAAPATPYRAPLE